MTGVIEHCDESAWSIVMTRAWSTVMRRSWSIVKTGDREHCDVEHCDDKCMAHCDAMGHGVLC